MKPSDYCVLSFPPKQGKSVTVSLFLYAVRAHLNFPILVLCKDDEEVHDWMSHLKKWTGFQEGGPKYIFISLMCKNYIKMKCEKLNLLVSSLNEK